MKRGLIILLSLVLLAGYVSAYNEQKCGDGYCDAGQYSANGAPGNLEIEDASTCFTDCAYTDYVSCSIDSQTGGTCSFKGIDYQIQVKNVSGCSSDQTADLSVSFNGYNREISGVSAQAYIQLADKVEILIGLSPCSAFVTKRTIYLKAPISPLELYNFVQLSKESYSLLNDKEIEVDYHFPINVSKPYCKTLIKNYDTQEEVAKSDLLGCYYDNKFTYPLEGLFPGKYVAVLEYFDQTATNRLGEKTIQFTINQCQDNQECSDNSLFTKDICEGEEIKVCGHSTNYAVILGISLPILFIVILILILIFRKKRT